MHDFFRDRGVEEFLSLIFEAERYEADFPKLMGWMLARAADRRDSFSYPELGEELYRWFEGCGGIFMVDDAKRCLLALNDQVYEIGGNRHFNALIYEATHLESLQYRAKIVLRSCKTCGSCAAPARRTFLQSVRGRMVVETEPESMNRRGRGGS